jgi:hypothetical protein
VTLVVAAPPEREPEWRYILGVVLGEFLGLDWRLETESRRDVRIRLNGEPGDLVLAGGLLASSDADWLTERSLPRAPFPLPSLWPDDPFGTAFFLLTRYEELVVGTRDAHDRFPLSASVLGQGDLLDRPLVNELVERLWTGLERRWPRLERRPRTFRFLPSHDVDWPYEPARSVRSAAADVLRRRDAGLAIRRLRGENVLDTFDLIMEASERAGLRSAFYFIAGHSRPGSVDGVYTLDEPWIRGLLRRIAGRGHEIGLHPSYDTFRDPERLRRERDALVQACGEEGIDQQAWGGRQHYLRWENPTTWQAWDDAGLAYDSTVGFAERPGFRCGVCYEFPVFDLRRRTELRLRERPLVAMDASLLQYEGLDVDATFRRLQDLAATCRRYRGDFTLLWHNNRLLGRPLQRRYAAALAGE